ncbi:MAG TPA: outer membrane protein transport protein [Kofleriaceae bacterium]|nr:outer membrane protein transport protein [Kofleriaceae bacterium]
MKLGGLTLTVVSCISGTAAAGGLILPGAGAVSTSRAGASVAATEDAESIGLNPAGIAKTKGTKVTVGAAAINYFMTFQRNGSYDDNPNDAESYEGQRYPVVTQDASPPLGIGRYQPVPVIGIVSDLGGRVPNLSVGFGLYAPNAYPFRRMNNVGGQNYYVENSTGYDYPAFGAPPPPTRYDIIAQEGAVILPSIVAAYRVIPDLDVGLRFSAGFADVKSTLAVWGSPGNTVEWIKGDGIFTLEAKDSFVMALGAGAAYRIGKNIELGANFTPQTNITARGDAHAINGPSVSLNGEPFMVRPTDGTPLCAAGGTAQFQKGCVQFALPMTATIGGRYKIVDENDKEKADIELDTTWEHWGKRCDYVSDPSCHSPSQFRVVVDAQVATASAPNNGINLKPNIVDHRFKDTFGVRLGGSYHIPAGANEVIARGGIAYDTRAAETGWERADLDGAARTTLAAGASYKMSRVQIDAGFGVVLEGTRTDSRNCNPVPDPSKQSAPPQNVPFSGCGPGDVQQAIDDRQGPDPVNPINTPESQLENPVNQGTYTSHYLMFMLGVSTWF